MILETAFTISLLALAATAFLLPLIIEVRRMVEAWSEVGKAAIKAGMVQKVEFGQKVWVKK